MRAPVHSFQSLPGHSQAPPLPGSPGMIHLWTYFLTMLVWPGVLRFSPGTTTRTQSRTRRLQGMILLTDQLQSWEVPRMP